MFDAEDTRVETIVTEITNTPWKERHAYVLPCLGGHAAFTARLRFSFAKQFHVSPFMPMDQRYDWCFGVPGEGLHVHMENFSRDDSGEQPLFDATLNLRRQEISSWSLARALLRFPLSSCAGHRAHPLAGAEAAASSARLFIRIPPDKLHQPGSQT